MRVGLYARVSTVDKGQDVTMQTRELHEYCERRGWIIAGEYVDVGVSGSKDSRPQLDKMMADAHRRKFDVVAVWKFDRFGRSLKHLVNALSEFESLSIAFVSLQDAVDLSTPQGRLMFGIISAMAEFERSMIQTRVRSGMANARSKGKHCGRPALTVDVAKIASLRDSGRSIREIAQALGVSIGTVHGYCSKRPCESAVASS
jgi:DNA invertase Pin-like site-specific DNA recombinase